MRRKVLLDTGVLVAFINKREKWHSWAITMWKTIEPPLLTCEAVITEACFLLQDIYEGEDAVMRLISRKTIEIPFHISEEAANIQILMKRFNKRS